jgi:hypothetical protein
MFEHTDLETKVIIALTTGTEALVRLFSDRLANFLDHGLIYTWQGYRAFVYDSYGYHDWDAELRELHNCLKSASEDEYGILFRHVCNRNSGEPERFRLSDFRL